MSRFASHVVEKKFVAGAVGLQPRVDKVSGVAHQSDGPEGRPNCSGLPGLGWVVGICDMAPHIYLAWTGASQPKQPSYDLTGQQQGQIPG